MTSFSRMSQVLLASFAFFFQGYVTAAAQTSAPDAVVSEDSDKKTPASSSGVAKFSAHAQQSRYTIVHKPWTQFLQAAVFDLGPSTRRPAKRRTGGVHTGTRVSTASRSRVRFEGNRVMFHLFNEDTLTFIAAYRDEMVGLMDSYDYADFSRDEQLAYWLNLHNAILIYEIAKVHPIGRPKNLRLRDYDNALLFDAKLVRVAGEPLSLNDIRHKIIYANWNTPEVLYGLWDGSIGGVDILTTAFTGANVWTLLRSNGNGYVNSLRGVETSTSRSGKTSFRVSKIYLESRSLFPGWPTDLYAHLDAHAGNKVGSFLTQPPQTLKFVRYDASTADFSGGEVRRFGGNDNMAAILSLRDDDGDPSGAIEDPENAVAGASATIIENFGAPTLNQTMRGGVSPDSIRLRDQEIENRKRRESDVTIEDVETPDEDDPETDASDPDAKEGESDASEGEN